MEEVNINLRLNIFIPEQSDTLSVRRKLPHGVICAITNALEHAIDDNSFSRWLPNGAEVKIERVGHDH